MTSWTLVTQSLRFYWRTHLAVVLGVTVSTAILVGALVVGDSVQHTLDVLALSRLGKIQLALVSQNRYFRVTLADDLDSALDTVAAPVLQMRGIASNSDGTARIGRVQVLGVDKRFWALAADEATFSSPSGDETVINERLAAQLGVGSGDDVLLRVEKTSLLPRDAPMSIGKDFSIALRMTVKSVASDPDFGRFSLQASQIAPFNAFVSIAWLQGKLDLPDRANMLLLGNVKYTPPHTPTQYRDGVNPSPTAIANAALRERWELADADLELRELSEQSAIELRTNRVFLDPPVVNAVERAMPGAVGILTYFVNELRRGDRTTPYSIVTAIDENSRTCCQLVQMLLNQYKLSKPAACSTNIPEILRDDEILINSWLAADLGANAGDVLEMTYFALGHKRKLEERRSSFRVRGILPMKGAAADPELMPVLPGLSNMENCRDWEPGIPIDLNKIRRKDEEYWDLYRGTPKAFVTLKAGQRMWSNRFGNLTALRYPFQYRDGINPSPTQIEAAIKRELDPASIGLFFQPVREQALAASAQAMDFGQLFLGLSFFLIIAALLLAGLLFVFGVEQRTEEMGALLAMGFLPHRVRRLLLFEGGILALLGGLLGAGGGVLYTRVVLRALSTVWRGAVGTRGMSLYYYAKPTTLVVGTAAGVIVALLAIWITFRGQARRPARELLATGGELSSRFGGGRTRSIARPIFGLLVTAGSVAAALAILIIVGTGRDAKAAGAFFGAGALLLMGCLGLSHALLSTLERRAKTQDAGLEMGRRGDEGAREREPGVHLTLRGMGIRNSARRWGRSLATIGLLACGSFLIIAIDANRHDPMQNAGQHWSGTGGFALYGESALPVLHDLNSKDGREVYRLDTDVLENVEFVPFRVHDGDDASCLNLNRPQNPRLLGVRPEDLQARGAFTFAKTILDAGRSTPKTGAQHPENDNPWLLLKNRELDTSIQDPASQAGSMWYSSSIQHPASSIQYPESNTINAIGDENTISWAIGKSVGDTLPYTDERGQTFYIRIAGAIASSILQGSLIVSEDEFIKRFPSESGYRMFLIDVPSDQIPPTPPLLKGGTEVSIPLLKEGTKVSTPEGKEGLRRISKKSANVGEVSGTLTRALQDVGLELTPTIKRLADFNTVQNTYLSIFQSLGGLALLLGSIGLGIVVLRNVMERRSELALLRAVGFENRSLHRLVLSEHWLLLFLGLASGIAAGLVAVLPALRSPGVDVPYVSLALTLFAILFSGALWTWFATRLALRGELLAALRNE